MRRRMAALLVFAPLIAEAQNVPAITLKPADARLDEVFAFVTSVRELSDGRVILTDGRRQKLVVADLRTGRIEPISRSGNGPGEYRMIAPVWPLSGDSSVMIARSSSRWLLFDGPRIVATLPRDAPVVRATTGAIRSVDRNGSVITFKPPPLRLGASAIGKGDSVRVLHVNRSTGQGDTIASLLARPMRAEVVMSDLGRRTNALPMHAPFATGEDALLFNDGWLAVARLDPYRVDWRAPDGRWTLGAPLPVPVVELNAREKQAYMERTTAKNQPVKSPDTVAEWTSTIPPFRPLSLLPSNDGQLCVLRTQTADHPETRYDVVDRRGILTAQLTLPANERIVTFGARSVYTVVRDDDDIERLTRHPWP